MKPNRNLFAPLSNMPFYFDTELFDMDIQPIYLAIQNNVVLGVFNSRPEADARIQAEIQKDRMNLLLKKGLLKKLLKKSSDFKFDDIYFVAEVKSYEIPQLF